MTVVLFTPLILSFDTTIQLDMAMSLSASGFLAGGILMSDYGELKRRIRDNNKLPLPLAAVVYSGLQVGTAIVALPRSTPSG